VSPASRPSTLAVAILGLLEAGPMHPYGLQRLIKLWGKDQVVNVGQRANLYRTINRLQEGGFIAVRHTERDQQFPERTVYDLTDAGRQASREWLTDMLASARYEFPEFPAALSFVMVLGPDETRSVLEQRANAVRERLAELDRELEQYRGELPRVSLLETDYLRAVTAAELSWLTSVLDDLRSGALTWSETDFDPASFELAGGDPSESRSPHAKR
jgi:DNA-binding PadR family transcriptional regulator